MELGKVFETEIGGKKVIVETGKYCEQANGSCLVRCGETVVMVNVTMAKQAREGIDFFPLGVDFEEKMYSVGKIPGGYKKREGRPSDQAILTSRLIDRPLRPLFPKGFFNDVAVVATALSVDPDIAIEPLAMLGSSIALTISVALFGMFLDWRAYHRISNCSVSKLIKYSFLSIVSISYLLILFTPVFMYFFINEDNSCHMMKLSMILLTTFLALTIPRQLFCALWLPVSSSRCWTFASALLSSALFIFFLYSVLVTRIDYQIKEIKVPYCNLPDEFNGYRIAFISDIHTGSMVDPIKETSDIIKKVFLNKTYGLQDIFTGMGLSNYNDLI